MQEAQVDVERNHSVSPGGGQTQPPRPTPDAVREELEMLLASPRFATSPRCQLLLRHVVEEALRGNGGSLKERNIGVEVFRRAPTYDTNADPVVRVAIGEIRKKLAQYYYELGNRDQLRIELHNGSYIPLFLVPEPASSETSSHHHKETQPAAIEIPSESASSVDLAPKSRLRGRIIKIATIAACVLVAGAGVLAWRAERAKSSLETFWAPALKSSHPVLICVGGLSPIPQALPSRTLGLWGDSVALVEVAAMLRGDNKPYSIRSDTATSYEDLQAGPIVLIGAFNNDWTIHFSQSMRFRFDQRADTLEEWIVDQKNPHARIGLVRADDSLTNQKSDVGVLARVLDPETKQPLIIIAGLTHSGTRAAGEFATNPQYLNEFLKTLPDNWQTKNLEVVLSVNVVDGEPGPPHVVMSSIW